MSGVVRSNEDQIQRLLGQAAELMARAETLANEPEDDFPHGAMIQWTRTFTEQSYLYGAMKIEAPAGDRWYLTSTRGLMVLHWTMLWRQHLSHADVGSIWWATEFTQPWEV